MLNQSLRRVLRAFRPTPSAKPSPPVASVLVPPCLDAPPPDPSLQGCPADTILDLTWCPGCGEKDRTSLFRFNRFALFAWEPDHRAAIYNYVLCHGCGIVYAAKRPAGERFKWLMEHFEDSLGRVGTPGGKVAITSKRLTDEERQRLQKLAAQGVYVSDHRGLKTNDYLPALMRDRLANSAHVEMMGSLIPMRGARVLEVRSRLGSISEALRRLFEADVQTMTLFENQQFLIEQVYGIPAVTGIDYDQFTVPYGGVFDVIIANHLLTHAVRPAELLAELRSHLTPGGHLYIYNEVNEAEYLDRGKSLFSINPFHLQVFTGPSLGRMLAANGFTTTFQTTLGDAHVCIAQKDDAAAAAPPRMNEQERSRRRSAYRAHQERAILTMPPESRWRVPDWEARLQQAVAAGAAELTTKGEVRLLNHKSRR